MVNSRSKGQRGEREWAKFLSDYGFEARRGQQFRGGPESPDVVSKDLDPYFHAEVKRVEGLRILPSLNQATEDRWPGRIPYVAWRKNGEDWVVFMWADDWIELVQEFIAMREGTNE